MFPLHSAVDGVCTCAKDNCTSPAKHPRTPRGLHDATTDEDTIRTWWRRWPDANVGVRTGEEAGVFVLDIDPRHDGTESLRTLVQEMAPLPETVVAATGGGGRHIFFAHPGIPIRNKTNLRPGIDVRGDGGYIVAPPSRHASGGEYGWKKGQSPKDLRPAPAPDWLVELLRDPPGGGAASGARSVLDDDNATLQAAASRYVEKVAGVGDGSRNSTAFRLAGHLASFEAERGGLRLSEPEILELLVGWNQRNNPPLPEAELEGVVHSATNNGTPRKAHVVRACRPGGRSDCTEGRAVSGDLAPDNWPEPQPLPERLPPVAPFDYRLLPVAFCDWIRDIANRIQCPPDFSAAASMVAIAGLVGRRIGIRPKEHDDWLVVPNLWGAAIGRPGIMKTPAIQEPLKPLHRLEREAASQYDEAQRDSEVQRLVTEAHRANTKRRIQDAVRKGEDPDGIAKDALIQEEDGLARKRYVANDVTVEKLGEILKENPSGITIYRDELIGLFRSLDKEGQEIARAFFLEAWNGTGQFTYDRIGRGTIDIEAAIVSIIGSIQPGPLEAYLRGAVRGGAGDDGLMQRFQLLVWPDVSKEWVNVDQSPDRSARAKAYEVFTRLDALEPADIGAIRDDDDPDGVPFLRFDADAQRTFNKWRAGLESKIRAGEEHPAVEAHLGKYRSLIPSLALLIHLADGGTGSVGAEALQKAIGWGVYLETHARRVYFVAISPGPAAAHALARRISKGDLGDGFTLKDVYRPCWTGLASRAEAVAAVELLDNLGWLRPHEEQTGGRPKTTFWINPRIREIHADGTAKTAGSPSEDLLAVPAVGPESTPAKNDADDWGEI